MNCSTVCRTNYADCSRKVGGHEATLFIKRTAAELLGQNGAVRLVSIVQRVIEIYELSDPGVELVISTVGKIVELYLDCLSEVMRPRLVSLQEIFARKITQGKEVVKKEQPKNKNGEEKKADEKKNYEDMKKTKS